MRIVLTKDLGPLRLAAIANVIKQVGDVRSQYLTVTPGQEMVYGEKEKQAIAVAQNPSIPANQVPEIEVERERLGDEEATLLDAAAIVLSMAQFWRTVSPIINRRKTLAVDAINAATTPAQITAATVIDWSDLPAPV